jgi:hypothetical protein
MAIEDVGRGDSVLLLAPTYGESEPRFCSELLDHGEAPDPAVLFVTLTDSPDERIEFWEDHVGELPALTRFVHTGELRGSGDSAEPDTVRVVRNPSNLTQLGVEITEALGELKDESENIGICFRSLSALLQYASPNQAFQFMQVLTDHFKHAGAIGHVHMNPDAHDKQTVATFTQVFDVVVELDEDGTHQFTK